MPEALTQFPVGLSHGFIPGPSGKLEVILSRSETHKPIIAVVCHPHPLHEGTMHNKVVTTLSRAFEQLGAATVRFNYRGVGQSDGDYGDMLGESEDLQAVIAWVQQQFPDYVLWLAGFSFGAFIAANVANQRDDVTQLVTVAPAVNHADFDVLTAVKCPWLIIQGDQDEVVPFEQVKAFAENPPVPVMFIAMPDVTHFFHGKLIELRETIKATMTGL